MNLILITKQAPLTDDPNIAQAIKDRQGEGIDNVIAKLDEEFSKIGLEKSEDTKTKYSTEIKYSSGNGREALCIYTKDCNIVTKEGGIIAALLYFDNVSEAHYGSIFVPLRDLENDGMFVHRMQDPKKLILDGVRWAMAKK